MAVHRVPRPCSRNRQENKGQYQASSSSAQGMGTASPARTGMGKCCGFVTAPQREPRLGPWPATSPGFVTGRAGTAPASPQQRRLPDQQDSLFFLKGIGNYADPNTPFLSFSPVFLKQGVISLYTAGFQGVPQHSMGTIMFPPDPSSKERES